MKGIFISLLALSLILTACTAFAPGSQTRQEALANILAFEDTNRNSQWDSGEPALPNTLIAARSNMHGTLTYLAQLTDAAGTTRIRTTYTHFFDLFAFSPCGYEATTPVLTAAHREVQFGFAPVDPKPGSAAVYILLWQDENQDGEYQSGEIPIAGEMLYINPGLPWDYDADILLGQLRAQTDSGGEAEANLGNHCGEVTVKIPPGWRRSAEPAGGQYFTTTYQPGQTNIYLGVVPDP